MSRSPFRFAQHLRTTLLLTAFVACDGDQGPPGNPGTPGANTVSETNPEPPGSNCAEGGIRVDFGVDTNGNGALDDSEILNTSYVCNGTGKSSLVRTSPEPIGANCPFGGSKIETGLDDNGNGELEDTEVDADATSFVCHFGPSGALSPSTGVNIVVKTVSTTAGSPIALRFTLRDDRGYPLDTKGAYSINTAIQPRFGLGYFTKDANGIVSPLKMYTKSVSSSNPAGNPTMYAPPSTGHGTLVENGLGAGDYTYTFPSTSTANGPLAVAYDQTKLSETHALWIQATRQTDLVFTQNANTYFAANKEHNFIPSGIGTPGRRQIAAQEKCDTCHDGFRPEIASSDAFHSGGRIDVGMCNVCHNPDRVSNPLADSASFVHRIHNGHNVADANLFHGIAATYPQDVRNCDGCHGGAAQGTQAQTNITTLACKGCHDYVSFTSSAPDFCGINGQLVYGADGKPVPCNHVAGPQPDNACGTCHNPGAAFATSRYHKPVAAPDKNNGWLVTGGNNNTHASYMAGVGYVPPGAAKITYDVKSVDAVDDAAIAPNKRPQITFKLKKDGADVVFQTFQAGVVTELMPNFVGSPSVYFAFAVPQDGVTAPTDFNASASGYIKKIWNGTATGTGAGTLTGPDGQGYYTIKLTGVQIPSTAKMLTGGLGYTYSLSSAPPLVQTNVPDYPWTPQTTPYDGRAQGGIAVPAPNVWKVATGYTGRRAIVDNAKCNNCHGFLGVAPSFHAGERNDGPTCSFCHTPNRASSGWSAGSKYFVHAVHAGRKRSVDFTWHAASQTQNFGDIEFPSTLNACTVCHTNNTFDFTNSTNFNSLPSQQLTTVATGTYNADPMTNSTYYTLSPYITPGVNYGSGFSFSAATGTAVEAAGSTLVISQITGACAACHDSSIALDHMRANGGQFYAQRSTVLAPNAPKEQCMICHGPGRVAAIGIVHQR